MSGQQAVAKGASLSPVHRLRQKQPQATAAAASLQIGAHVLVSQPAGQVARALPRLGVVGVEDEEMGLALFIQQICAQRDLAPQVGKQVVHVEGFVNADVAAVIKLVGVQVPALDEPLGQHQGWSREFCVWNQQAFRGCHCRISIARWSSVRQAGAQRWEGGRFAFNSKYKYNM